MGAFLSSLLAIICFAVYVPLFVFALTTLTKGEVKIRRAIKGGVEIKRITGYRAMVYALGQFLTWFPAAYGAFMTIRTNQIGLLFIGVIFSMAIGYTNTQIAQRMIGDVRQLTFEQLGFKFNLQKFAQNRWHIPTNDDPQDKRKNMPDDDQIEDVIFYDVTDDDEKSKRDDV